MIAGVSSLPRLGAPALFFGGAVAQADAQIVGQLLLAGIVALVTGVLSSYITSRVLAARYDDLRDLVGRHGDEIAALLRRQADLSVERAHCEARAGRQFASHAEVAHSISQSMAQFEGILTRVDSVKDLIRNEMAGVHQRVDTNAKDIAGVQGQLKAAAREHLNVST